MCGDTGGGALRVLLGRVRGQRRRNAMAESRGGRIGIRWIEWGGWGRRGGSIDRNDPPSVLSVCHSACKKATREQGCGRYGAGYGLRDAGCGRGSEAIDRRRWVRTNRMRASFASELCGTGSAPGCYKR